MEVIYINTSVKYMNVGLRVSPTVTNWVLHRSYVYIGNSCCPVKNRISIKQCRYCQKIGHLAKDCAKKDLEPIFLYCSQAHCWASCPNKQNRDMQVCCNCSHRKTFLTPNKHQSNSHECPFFKQELARLQQKIDYTSKNVI